MNITSILTEELEKLREDLIVSYEQSAEFRDPRIRDAFNIVEINSTSAALEENVFMEGLEEPDEENAMNDILQRWAEAKGITFSSEKDFTRWASSIRSKIKKEGTTLYRSSLTPEFHTLPVAEFEERLSSRIAEYYSQQIMNHLPQ